VPIFTRVTGEGESASDAHASHGAMGAMNDMAGLVLVINVKPRSSASVRAAGRTPHKIDLLIEPNAGDAKSRTFSCSVFNHGTKHRLRVINMAPNLGANVQLGNRQHPVTWRAVAKDGATLPPRLAKSQDARLHIVSGEA